MADTQPLSGVQAILVDDDPDSNDLSCRVLETAGAATLCVETAREALRAVNGRRFDVLVSDLSMPDEDGFWLARQVIACRDALPNPDLCLVAVTAHVQKEFRAAAEQAGFHAFVAKPFDPDAFVRVIALLLRLGQGRCSSSR